MANSDISYSDLKALLAKSNEGLVVVDVRTNEEVEGGSIPGSIHIPVDSVETALALYPVEFQKKYGVTKPPLDAPELVFYCQLGRRGRLATDRAQRLGFQKAVNYAGGYKDWLEKQRK
ncbi:hypothetical protein DPEC_G00020580 [Dallia pectoralis]|uniref:Uncharacterized protein n=1 Tax=Dallia pectoralis TaxID=75939 RepID=A0ACC2HGT9_DALPE|nr:hypothetical protein DPEC_G00020580 [Dallia pectoralis]